MSRRDEAVEAGARAIFDTRDDAYDLDEWDDLDSYDRERYQCDSRNALDAALAVLYPTVPNQVDALDALPVGTVLRGDAREEGVILAHLTDLGWMDSEGPYDSTRLLFRHADLLGVAEWAVIYQPEGDS